eukprot:m.352101 g.352101  ORF g.352101 m.352101 type:complete len:112 (-) comp16440_c0_seq1:203-538(-)
MAGRQSDYQLAQTQAEVDQVVGVMRTNMQKVLDRDAKISDLQDRADELNDGATRFQQNSRKLKRHMWWQNTKMTLMLVLVVLAILGIIIGVAVAKRRNRTPATPAPTTAAP